MKKILPFILLIIFSSCIDLEKNKWMSDIDKMSLSVKNMQDEITIHSSKNLKKVQDNIVANELKIEQLYHNDTLDIQFAQTMSRYKIIREVLTPLINRAAYLDSSLNKENKQLNKLKSDISESAGKRNHYTDYISQEKKNVMLLQNLFNTFVKQQKITEKELTDLQADVDKIIEHLSRS